MRVARPARRSCCCFFFRVGRHVHAGWEALPLKEDVVAALL